MAVPDIIAEFQPDRVVNLAAQVGVRYSIDNPLAYVEANLVGFANILEGCRHNNVKHLVYASSSSVYGANKVSPFSVHHPVSLYAATKKANELMAHTYSHLYGLPTTGLRFFIEGIVRVLARPPQSDPDWDAVRADSSSSGAPYRLYNIGNNKPVELPNTSIELGLGLFVEWFKEWETGVGFDNIGCIYYKSSL